MVAKSNENSAKLTRETDKPTPELDKFNLAWDYILMKPIITEATKAGLVLPSGSQLTTINKSLVYKSGPGAYRDSGAFVPNPIKPGHIVHHMGMIKPFTIKLDDEDFLIVSGRDCVAFSDQ